MTFASGYFEIKKFKGLRKSEFHYCFIMHARLHEDIIVLFGKFLAEEIAKK